MTLPKGPLEIEPAKQKLLPFFERDVKMRCVVSLHYTFEYRLYNGKVLENSHKYKIREAKFMWMRNIEKKGAGVYTF